ncbi:hypothetical protein [Granulicella tundricola]|uniref:Uncharacterized protein n=1 Tax=Granulicella tundricola (strain ATCC BAA-1859 / DSM 23138 / MP5ACTX9) TaxID=1198114 RepID=E8WZ72_GRATM|nr:hypothetical protein [Granulicella tundricola]ADW67674.1 hypothetical protein AciX9_0603 [Granulicella tundricola MP5ACTX9]
MSANDTVTQTLPDVPVPPVQPVAVDVEAVAAEAVSADVQADLSMEPPPPPRAEAMPIVKMSNPHESGL